MRESILLLQKLKDEHNESLYENRFSNSLPSNTLSTIVDPSILRLIESDDKSGMNLLGPFFNK